MADSVRQFDINLADFGWRTGATVGIFIEEFVSVVRSEVLVDRHLSEGSCGPVIVWVDRHWGLDRRNLAGKLCIGVVLLVA